MNSDKAVREIDRARIELRKTRYGWPENDKPLGHMKRVDDALKAARAALVPPHAAIDLGPVIKGGASVMLHDLTHETDGYTALGSVWPAFDELHAPGSAVLAPEALEITAWGSAQGGEAVHAKGASGLLYWFGHVDRRKPVGSKVKRGVSFCKISAEHKTPHVHVAIDGRPVLGRDFLHHDDYTHGAPKIGAQLKAAGH